MTEGIERLALLVKAVHRRGMRDMNAALSDLGLTAPQAEALTVLARAGSLSLRELGRLLIAEGGHPSRLVDRLVAAGLVSRDEAPDDRRRVTLRLTPAGRRLHEQAAERADAVFARYTTHLQGADVAAACDALAALLEGSDLAEVVQRRVDERAPAGAPRPSNAG